MKLKNVESAILLGLGLQHKSVDDMVIELDMPANQLLALFNKAIRRLSEYFDKICINAIRSKMETESAQRAESSGVPSTLQPVPISLEVCQTSYHTLIYFLIKPHAFS